MSAPWSGVGPSQDHAVRIEQFDFRAEFVHFHVPMRAAVVDPIVDERLPFACVATGTKNGRLSILMPGYGRGAIFSGAAMSSDG
jgi:hypothetical protein